QGPESADAAEHPRREGVAGMVANALLGGVRYGDVYSRFGVFHGQRLGSVSRRGVSDHGRRSAWRILDGREGGCGIYFENCYFTENKSTALKRPEQPFPSHQARMKQRAGIRQKAFADLPRLPSIGGYVERHIDHHRCADDVVARDAAPKAAVIGIGAVVAHRKVAIVGKLVGVLAASRA